MNELKIEILLDSVIKRNSSDLHIQVAMPPMFRVDGSLAPMPGYQPLKESDVETLIFSVLDEEQKKILLKDKEFDFSFAFGDQARFRVNAFHESGNLAMALRLIPTKILTIEELGLPPIVNKFTDYPRGLVLFTGPTGAGKSTTIASIINKINTEKSLHIITIEDPIEYMHKSIKSAVVQREVHYDTFSYGVALRSVLREDPDVVLIGEMRDLETIAAAITIAETGHLVFATLHTNSASQSIDRMIDVFPPHQQSQIRTQLSNILMAICSQRLIPTIGGGRIAAAEILIATPAVRNIIRDGKSHQLEAVIQTGAQFGMQSMDKTLADLVQKGIITFDEANVFAVDPDELERMVRE
jgi:twitching motility protein PilT